MKDLTPISDPMIPQAPISEPYLYPIERAEFAYTNLQRDWWLKVYGGRCHFTNYTEDRGFFICDRSDRIEIHHITPGSYIRAQRPDLDPNQINFMENHLGIALCKAHHIFVIHPDIGEAFQNYGQDKDGISKVIKRHKELAALGEIFWNDNFDQLMLHTATEAIGNYMISNPGDFYPLDVSWSKQQRPKKKRWFDDTF